MSEKDYLDLLQAAIHRQLNIMEPKDNEPDCEVIECVSPEPKGSFKASVLELSFSPIDSSNSSSPSPLAKAMKRGIPQKHGAANKKRVNPTEVKGIMVKGKKGFATTSAYKAACRNNKSGIPREITIKVYKNMEKMNNIQFEILEQLKLLEQSLVVCNSSDDGASLSDEGTSGIATHKNIFEI